MELQILRIWNQKDDWFRDHTQADRVGGVVVHRLADDRNQEECRYLMRLKWHFHMSYQEVSYRELEQYVSVDKMRILNELFAYIAVKDYAGIEMWLEQYEKELPIIEDRWMQENRAKEEVPDYPDGAI
jgi:hypothetical protein